MDDTWRSSITIGSQREDFPATELGGTLVLGLRPAPPQPAAVSRISNLVEREVRRHQGRFASWLMPQPLITSWLPSQASSIPDAGTERWVVSMGAASAASPLALIAEASALRPRLAARSGDPDVLARLAVPWLGAHCMVVEPTSAQVVQADDLVAGLLAWLVLVGAPNPWEDERVQALARVMPLPPSRRGLRVHQGSGSASGPDDLLRWRRVLGVGP